MPLRNAKGEIRGAGGVVVDPGPDALRVLMVHRPQFDDWSLPKGKVDRGEDDSEAALREVREETGLQCDLGVEVGEMHYRDRKGRAKVARYWLMRPRAGSFEPSVEVDHCAWMTIDVAAERATRSGDRDFLRGLSAVARCVPAAVGYDVEVTGPVVVYEEG